MAYSSFLLQIVQLLCAIISLSSCQTVCTNQKVCSAVCNGKTIDVSFLYKNLIIENGNNEYVFSCNGDQCGEKNMSSAICQRSQSDPQGGDSYSCGASNASTWTVLSTDPFVLNITYSKGDEGHVSKPRSAFINITVNPELEGGPELTYTGEKGAGFYTFDFIVSSLTPPKSNSSVTEGYVGWILISLSLIGFLLYFLIGGVIMRFSRGARGLEMIPNLMFWRSFPFLLKDGFLLTISPCYSIYKRGYNRL